MKLIFLDIDGVLNDWERPWRDVGDYDPQIVPRCVKAFNRIIRETEAKIVLSSTWRNLIISEHMSLRGFQVFLTSHGVRGELIGYTREDGDEYRWQEIAAWLCDPKLPSGECLKGKIYRYAIIDDTPEAFGGRPGVQTAGGKGLTDDDAEMVIEILNG